MENQYEKVTVIKREDVIDCLDLISEYYSLDVFGSSTDYLQDLLHHEFSIIVPILVIEDILGSLRPLPF
jgi:hypothetical protein